MYKKVAKAYLALILLGLIFVAAFYIVFFVTPSDVPADGFYLSQFIILISMLLLSLFIIRFLYVKKCNIKGIKAGAIFFFIFSLLFLLPVSMLVHATVVPMEPSQSGSDGMFAGILIAFIFIPELMLFLSGLFFSCKAYMQLR